MLALVPAEPSSVACFYCRSNIHIWLYVLEIVASSAETLNVQNVLTSHYTVC